MTKLYNKFIGKICTIITDPTKFPFPIEDPKRHAHFFTGQVIGIDEDGVLIKNINTNTHAFYAFPIVGILEEQVVSKNDPNFERIKEELEQKKKPAIQKPAPQIALSMEDMTKMAKQIKSRQGTHQSSSET